MDRWKHRVTLVAGASIEIEAAVAKTLVQHGMTVYYTKMLCNMLAYK